MSQEPVEVFSKDTFLTALRNGSTSHHDPANTAPKSTVEEPAAMTMVREKHAQLHEVVGSLSEKISAVLGRQEKDFLAAYRAHMYNVQKELHELREKIHRNETVENKSEKIKKIEEERDWYRREALRLDAFTTAMTKDLKYMREKLESIEEDRNWLEKQLKACKKQNKLLRAELDVRIAPGANGMDGSFLPPFDSPHGSFNAGKKARRSSDPRDESSLPQLSSDLNSPMLVEEREQQFRRQIKALKKELQQKTQTIGAMRKQQLLFGKDGGVLGESRSHLENFFLQCVESVKVEVVKRRSAAMDTNHGRSDKVRNQKHDVGTELEDFSSSDRVRVIERLLAHDEVLTLLYEHLFSSPQSSRRDRPSTTDSDSRHHDPPLSPSDSTKSLPEMAPPSTRKVSFEVNERIGQPAGSGAAAASAARGSGGLPIDDSTRDYLRSM